MLGKYRNFLGKGTIKTTKQHNQAFITSTTKSKKKYFSEKTIARRLKNHL